MSNAIAVEVQQLPPMQESTGLLDDPAALAHQWEANGYWYFRDVLPLAAVERFRAPVLDQLKAIDVVDAREQTPLWNGQSMERFPKATHAGYEMFPGLSRSRRWRDFLASPAVESFFARVLGAKPQWVPVAELRITPPGERVGESRFTYPHQDGFYNEGYRCLTAWLPLWPVSRIVGGLAVAQGMHRTGYLHDRNRPPRFPIPTEAIPAHCWRSADYLPGDVVIFDRHLPHSGLRNRSDRHFRVSFDVRCVLPGDAAPVVGVVEQSTAIDIVIRDEQGAVHRLALIDTSYCRATGAESGKRIDLVEVPRWYPPGTEVMATVCDGAVALLREPKY